MTTFISRIVCSFSLLFAPYISAAFITLNEDALDRIYSQSNFGQNTIDIRVGAATELVFPELLDITTDAEVDLLFAQHLGPANVVNFYFIDTIKACGGTISNRIVGCGEYFGNDFVVESSFAAGRYGGELLAHELGHNLGLPHLSGNYLMNPILNNRTLITETEVDRIFRSRLVQNDDINFWIDINPVLVVAQASRVSEPSTVALFMLILLYMAWCNQVKTPLTPSRTVAYQAN